jgi:hypothetical protein
MEKTDIEQDKDHFEEDYNKLSYDLPDLSKLKEDFDVEKVYDKDSEFLLRSIRRVMTEKLSSYSQFFETLMNPSGPPMFIYTLIRGMELKEKESVKEIYNKLSKIQIKSIKLDTIYSEEGEAKFIIETMKAWQDMKKNIYDLVEKMEKNHEGGKEVSTRDYFG